MKKLLREYLQYHFLFCFLIAGDPINIDGSFEDWINVPISYSDSFGDGIVSDFSELKITHDDEFIFIYLSFHDGEFLFQDWNEFQLYIDADNDENTGHPVAGIGAELEWCFGCRSGFQHINSQDIILMQNDISLRIGPTVTSREFEVAILRSSMALTMNNTQLLEEGSIVIFESEAQSDRLPNESGGVSFTIGDDITNPVIPIPLEKMDEVDIRIVTYNTLNEGILDPERESYFKRIFQALDPDIIALQENSDWNQIDEIIQSWFPEDVWHASWTYRDLVILSKFPIINDANLISSDRTMCALLNTEQELGKNLLIINSHLSCCANNEDRQEQVDEFLSVWRGWVSENEGPFLLEEGTPFVHLGDFNFVGYRHQVETIRVGDIQDENQYGIDFFPDWDSTGIVDLLSRHTQKRMGYTWQNDNSSYNPGKLDYIFYSDALLDKGRHFILNTRVMDEQILDFYGLELDDTYLASDHLPRVFDVRLATNIDIKGEKIIPDNFKILNSFPNPFNSSININFLVSSSIYTKITIFDIKGNKINELIDEIKPTGSYSVTWNGMSEKGSPISTGLYFILFEFNGQHVETEKVVFLK